MDLRRVAPTGEWCVFHREGAGGGTPPRLRRIAGGTLWRLSTMSRRKRKLAQDQSIESGNGSLDKDRTYIRVPRPTNRATGMALGRLASSSTGGYKVQGKTQPQLIIKPHVSPIGRVWVW